MNDDDLNDWCGSPLYLLIAALVLVASVLASVVWPDVWFAGWSVR